MIGIKTGAARIAGALSLFEKAQQQIEQGIDELRTQETNLGAQLTALAQKQGDVITQRMAAERSLFGISRLLGR